jgi:RNA polymerase sigma-70 factor (ECF subfamily)
MQSRVGAGAAFELGQEAWPGVSLRPERFAAHAEQLGITGRGLLDRASDLYLACACAGGDPQAVRYFESELLSQVDLFVARFSLAQHALDDVRQRLRVKLLVGRSPGIGRYRGQGSLGAWVRITAVRIAIDVAGAAQTLSVTDVDLLDLTTAIDEGPESSAARSLYRERVQGAIDEALRNLEPRDKTLLRLFVVDGLNIEAIGVIYRVHRATVARWIVAIRARVLLAVRAGLGLKTPPSPSEMRSLIGLLRDDIHLSARRLLCSESDRCQPAGERL